jgi:hypothetical protein
MIDEDEEKLDANLFENDQKTKDFIGKILELEKKKF